MKSERWNPPSKSSPNASATPWGWPIPLWVAWVLTVAGCMADLNATDNGPQTSQAIAQLQVGGRSALLVVANGQSPRPAEVALGNRLTGQGFTVSFASAPAQSADWTGKDLILVSSYINSANHASLRDVPVPVISWENWGFDEMGFASAQGIESTAQLEIQSPGHPLAAGLSGTLTIYNSATDMRWATPVSGSIAIASLVGQPERATVIGVPAGAALTSGVAPAPRVGLFLADTGFTSLNAQGLALLDAAISWALDLPVDPPPPPVDDGRLQALFVVPNGSAPQSADVALANDLQAQGFSVTYTSAPASSADWADKDLILVSSYINSARHASLRDAPVPVVSWENWGFDEMGFSTGQGTVNGADVALVSPGHPLAGGLSGTVAVYNTATTLRWATPVDAATVIASVPGQPERATILGVSAGAPLSFGPAPARRVGLFMADNAYPNLTAAGQSLVQAAIDWALSTDPDPEPINQPPVVDAGSNATGVVGQMLALDPSIQDDGTYSVQWSGAGLQFSNPAQETSSVTAAAAGSFTATLTVDDGEFNVSDQVTLTFEDPVVDPPPPPPDGQAYELLLIVNNPTSLDAADRAVIERLQAAGHQVEVVRANTDASAAAGKHAVLLSSSVNSGEVSSTWTFAAVPLLSWEAFFWDDLGMIAGAPTILDDAYVRIVSAGHPLAARQTGVRRLSANQATLAAVPGPGALTIATLDSDVSLSSYFAYEAGANMPGGTAPARRVALPLGLTLASALTADGSDLLHAALAWAVGDSFEPSDRVQLLGDSITRGTGGFSGYRQPLSGLLDAAACDYNFVGTLRAAANNQLPSALFDWDHEGHGGFTTGQVLTALSDYLEGNVPHISLIHLGSNDLLQGVDPIVAKQNLLDIITELRFDNPQVVVLLAQIIDSSRSEMVGQIGPFNQLIAEAAAETNQPGSPVVLVDLHTGYDDALLNFDGLHPNPSGEQFMADRWYAAVRPFLSCQP